MTGIGYALSSEEHPPERLVELARRAEDAGFDFAMLSDHYHPWTSRQGQSPFAWAVLGALAQATSRMQISTGVTCPTTRIHPAVIAQAAATTARLFRARFMLGLGSGENLNEHIVGEGWPEPATHLARLEEAIELIRRLWEGESVTHRGTHFIVDEAHLFTLPDSPPPILVAATGADAAELAGRLADGLIGVEPDGELVKAFEHSGGKGKPRLGQVTVCHARSRAEGRRIALEAWPNSGLPCGLAWEIKTTEQFDRAVELVREEHLESLVCGAAVEDFAEAVQKYEAAGFDRVWFHQVGSEQDAFLEFASRELLPALRGGEQPARRAAGRPRRR